MDLRVRRRWEGVETLIPVESERLGVKGAEHPCCTMTLVIVC